MCFEWITRLVFFVCLKWKALKSKNEESKSCLPLREANAITWADGLHWIVDTLISSSLTNDLLFFKSSTYSLMDFQFLQTVFIQLVCGV